jgi:hypothetical protein
LHRLTNEPVVECGGAEESSLLRLGRLISALRLDLRM